MIAKKQSEKYVQAKQEGEDNAVITPLSTNQISSRLSTPLTISSTSSRQWLGFQNSRTVLDSRVFGGKYRHSKVWTTRGSRDRRIRFSVPTAIQLYDLQERLGFSRPGKVVDWLLDVAKNEIDELPPLQMPPGGFSPQDYSSSTILANHSQVCGSHSFERGTIFTSPPKDQQGNLENYEDYASLHHQLLAENFSPLANNQIYSLQECLNNNNGLSYNSNYFHSEPPNLTLSQFGNHSLNSQFINNSDTTSNNSSHIPTVQSIFAPTYPPPFMNLSSSMENEKSRQMMINNFQLSSSSSQQNVVPNSQYD